MIGFRVSIIDVLCWTCSDKSSHMIGVLKNGFLDIALVPSLELFFTPYFVNCGGVYGFNGIAFLQTMVDGK